ncbi:2201_t:CDS:2, partial [Entrophospora sp. SA101]
QSRDAEGKYLSKRIYNANSKVDETRQKENLKEKELDKLDITKLTVKDCSDGTDNCCTSFE